MQGNQRWAASRHFWPGCRYRGSSVNHRTTGALLLHSLLHPISTTSPPNDPARPEVYAEPSGGGEGGEPRPPRTSRASMLRKAGGTWRFSPWGASSSPLRAGRCLRSQELPPSPSFGPPPQPPLPVQCPGTHGRGRQHGTQTRKPARSQLLQKSQVNTAPNSSYTFRGTPGPWDKGQQRGFSPLSTQL